MSSSLDSYLILKYREMFGLDNISNISINTTFKGHTSILSSLNVVNNYINNNNISLLSNLNTNNYINNLNTTIQSNLIVNNNSLLNNINTANLECNNITNYNKLSVDNNTTINNNTSIMSNLYVNNMNLSNLLVPNILSYNTTLSLLSNIINIGTNNSTININGTSLYVASTDLKINDKILSLNINPTTLLAFDMGDLSGFEIMGTSNSGFIKSNYLGSLITIKPPLSIEQNILTLNNDDMYITGYSILNDNVELYKSLDITHNLTTKTLTVGSNLNVFNNLLVNDITNNTNLYISGNTILNNITSNSIFINNNLIFNNTTVLSSLNVNSNIYTNNTFYNKNLNVINTTLLNNTSCLSDLKINNNSYLNNINTFNINISNITILNNNTSLLSTLNINNNFTINGTNTFCTNLQTNNITFSNNITTKSNLNILSKIIMKIPEYNDNQSAINAGLAIGTWYRTGGVLKIRLNTIDPTIDGTVLLILPNNTNGWSSSNDFVGNTITNNGNVSWSSNGLLLDGNSWLSLTVPTGFNLGNDNITFEVLFTLNSYNGSRASFMEQFPPPFSRAGDWSMRVQSGNIGITIYDGSYGWRDTYISKTISLNVLHHFATVFKGGYVYIYWDGSLVNSAQLSNSGTLNTTIGSSSYPILIGRNQESGYNISGSISVARIVKKALYTGSTYTVPTVAQIRTYYGV
jgi:hypothetical protein